MIIVLYDESDRADGQDPALGTGGHTVCAVISPLVRPGEYSTVTYVYSMLRTLQDGFGVQTDAFGQPSYLGAANQVSPLPVSWN